MKEWINYGVYRFIIKRGTHEKFREMRGLFSFELRNFIFRIQEKGDITKKNIREFAYNIGAIFDFLEKTLESYSYIYHMKEIWKNKVAEEHEIKRSEMDFKERCIKFLTTCQACFDQMILKASRGKTTRFTFDFLNKACNEFFDNLGFLNEWKAAIKSS